MNIDWSKAPEGATHKDTSCPGGFWYKFDYEVNKAAFCQQGETEWVPSGPATAYNDGSMDNMVARPKVLGAPSGATHKWTASGQFAKRCGGNTWAIWQDHEWLWIGDEFKGIMVAIDDEREWAVTQMLKDCREGAPKNDFVLTEVSVAHFIKRTLGRLYDKGYRKFEIVEEDV